MRLVQPTDFEILAVLADSGRNIAANLSIELDQDRAYLNTRLPHLRDHGLVNKIGPAENSGLYEITDRGRATVECRDQYDEVGANRFEDLIKQ